MYSNYLIKMQESAFEMVADPEEHRVVIVVSGLQFQVFAEPFVAFSKLSVIIFFQLESLQYVCPLLPLSNHPSYCANLYFLIFQCFAHRNVNTSL